MLSKKHALFFLKISITVGLVVLLVGNVDWKLIGNEFKEASLPFVFLALGFYVIGLVLSIGRWVSTAKKKLFPIRFREAITYHVTGLFLNNFFPSTLGGDAYRSYLLGRAEKRYAAAASTVLFVRFVGLWATIALFLGFGLVAYGSVFSQSLFLPFGIGLLIFLLVDVLVTIYWGHARFQKLFAFFPERFRHFFHEVGGYADGRFLWESFFVSVAFSFVGVGLFNLALFWSFGEQVPILPYLSVVFLISVVSSLPVSVNNIGLKEWAYYTFFPAIGISAEAALAVALLGRFLQMFVSLFGIPFFFRDRRITREAKRREINA